MQVLKFGTIVFKVVGLGGWRSLIGEGGGCCVPFLIVGYIGRMQ